MAIRKRMLYLITDMASDFNKITGTSFESGLNLRFEQSETSNRKIYKKDLFRD